MTHPIKAAITVGDPKHAQEKRPQLARDSVRPSSVENPANALRVRRAEVVFWIEQGWIRASIACRGKQRSYTITPEALVSLYKQHHADVLKRGIPNQALFEAFVQYCVAPKHTVGEQLLDVRRDKRELAAYAAAVGDETSGGEEEEEEGDEDDDQRYGVAMAESCAPAGEAGCQDE